VDFGEAVTGFEASDITVVNGVVTNFAMVSTTNYTFDVVAAADGPVTVTVDAAAATDLAGNPSEVSNTIELTYDATVPAITNVTATPSAAGDGVQVRLVFEVIDASAITNTTLTVNGRAGTSVSVSNTVYTYTYTIQEEDTDQEWAEVVVTATDAAGNTGTLTNDDSVLFVDKRLPVITSLVAEPTPAPEGAVVAITLEPTFFNPPDQDPVVTVNGAPRTLLLATNGLYHYEYTVTAGDDDGPATIVVALSDVASNRATYTNTTALIIDKTAPAIAIDSVTPSPAKRDEVVTMDFSIDDISTITNLLVEVNDRTADQISVSNGLYRYEYTVLAADGDGAAEIVIAAIDAAGNHSHITNMTALVTDQSPSILVLGIDDETIVENAAPSLDRGTDFGYRLAGVVTTNVFTLTNNWTQTAILDYTITGTASNAFNLVELPGTLAPGEAAARLEVAFAPDMPGDFEAVLELTHNGPDQMFRIQLAGSAYLVEPAHGPLAGGNEVVITNGQFGTITNLVVDHIDPVDPIASGTNWLRVVMPTAAEAGLVDLVIQTSDNGEILLPQAYRYNPAGVITSVVPAEASWQGGAEVTILGENLTDPTDPSDLVGVTLAGVPVAVVLGTNSTGIVVVADATAGPVTGAVEVVSRAFGTTTLPEGFAYVRAVDTVSFTLPETARTTDAFVLSATVESGLPVIFSITNGPGQISHGTNLTFTTAGMVEVVALQVGNTNWFPASATNVIDVSKDAGIVTLLDLEQTYDGTARIVTAETVPTNLFVLVTYDGTNVAPANAGSYEVIGLIEDLIYAGSVTGTLVVAKVDQTIDFPQPSDASTTAGIVLDATASSGLPVAFVVIEGPGVITDGSNLTFTGSGDITIRATQDGDQNWNPAQPVERVMTVEKTPASIVLHDLEQVFDGTPRVVTFSTDPTDLFARITYAGSPDAPVHAGSYEVVGIIEDAIYAGTATSTLVVARASQSIDFDLAETAEAPDMLAMVAEATSGLPVAFDVVEGPGVVTNQTTLAFTTAGTVVVRAMQAGDTNWLAAAHVTNTVVVTKADAIVTLTNLVQVYDGTPRAVEALTAPDPELLVEILYGGSTNIPVHAGSYAINANVIDPWYQGSFTSLLEIARAPQEIDFPEIETQSVTNRVELLATATSGLDVMFEVLSGPANWDGTNLTFTTEGEIVVAASQPGNTNWLAALDVTNVFQVTKAPALIEVLDLEQTYDGTVREVSVATVPTNLAFVVLYNGLDMAPTNAGRYEVVATIDDMLYMGSVTGVLQVAQATQRMAFALQPTAHITETIVLAGTATSGLPVAFAVVDGPGIITNELELVFTSDGDVTVVASQAGDVNWAAADPMTNVVTVSKTPALVQLHDLDQVYDGTAREVMITTDPEGLFLTLTYAGGADAPADAGSYEVIATIDDALYAGVATGTLVVARAGDTIALFGDTNVVYNGSSHALTAESGSGSPVTITYNGDPVAPVNAGTYAVLAVVDEPNWQAVVETTLHVAKADQEILDFLPATTTRFTIGDATNLSASASSGLPVSFVNETPEIVDIILPTVSFTGIGFARVRAEQVGDANWNPVSVTHTWPVGNVITTVTPGMANIGGGIEVRVAGLYLGDGSDIAEVWLAGVPATIVTQDVHSVTVIAEAAMDGPVTGAVRLVSASAGTLASEADLFAYRPFAAPTQLDPAGITESGFTVRWEAVDGAERYYLDIAADTNFIDRLPQYSQLDVGISSQYAVGGLIAGQWYAVRLFAWNEHGFSLPSRTVWVPTGANTPYESRILPDAPVSAGGVIEQDMRLLFHGVGLVYGVTSSDPTVVQASMRDAILVLNPVGPGSAEITVTATDPNTGYTASASFTIHVVGNPELTHSSFRPREDWYWLDEQELTYFNPTGVDAIGIRLLFSNIKPGIQIQNTSGTSWDGRPMIEQYLPIPAGSSQTFVVGYYSGGSYDVRNYPPTVEAQFILPALRELLPAGGVRVNRVERLDDGRFVLTFETEVGRVYVIEYMNNFPTGDWIEVPVRIQATANWTQWIDAGPPSTLAPEGVRVYQIKVLD